MRVPSSAEAAWPQRAPGNSTDAAACARCSSLEEQLSALQRENDALREQLARIKGNEVAVNNSDNALSSDTMSENKLIMGTPSFDTNNDSDSDLTAASLPSPVSAPHPPVNTFSPMTRSELQRYGRQMLVKEFGGVASQLKLRSAKVLVVGVGGLGSPVALYLAAMGVGHLGLVDDDRVERSNLHRQVIHDESTLHEAKVTSAIKRIAKLNPDVYCEAYPIRLNGVNVLELVMQYDVVVDASDNVATRYLVNDACALARKPLVSGSALGLEGQVTVFTFSDDDDALASESGCYRCLYPKPQPSAAAMSCSENGVLGVVPGVIGCLQAVETIKVLTGFGEPLMGVQCFYDAYDGQFRRLKIGTKRRSDCAACSPSARLQFSSSSSSPQLRAEQLVCADASATVSLAPEHYISAKDFGTFRKNNNCSSYVLLDTRARNQFDMVHFPEAVHMPFESFVKQEQQQCGDPQSLIGQFLQRPTSETSNSAHQKTTTTYPNRTFVICRRGVDSMVVTQWLVTNGVVNVQNVDGGYIEYARSVDQSFPMY